MLFNAKLLVAGVSLCLVGCASEGGSTQTRELGEVTAMSQQLESGDLDVRLLDAEHVEVASLRWHADSRTTEWEIVDLQQGVIDGAYLTLDTADQALFDIWALGSGADVAYDPTGCEYWSNGMCCYTCTTYGFLVTCIGSAFQGGIEVGYYYSDC